MESGSCNLNKACPKDYYPLLQINQLVNVITGHKLFTFMDVYSCYNQIKMHVSDQENTSFIIEQGLYSYKVMLFDIKNVGTPTREW